MVVEVQLEGHLNQFRTDRRNRFQLDLPSGATVRQLMDAAGVPWAEVGATAVNGRGVPESVVLHDGDRVILLAPLAGG